ncbi:60S ribosomal protein L2, mitochondrial-like [Solanum tuberosum]|uniref:60S ribosomal protein L2, mitochondrial-like n=1 Tax=Solanum tuberosum TaxID=4113 RepID=UPI00073A06F5|nr:PREDICTED: 60S ribosomal protein L2, mitochondrial-like [Solanum tuberosum]
MTCANDVFFSTLSSTKAKGETATHFFGSSFDFPRIAVTGSKPAFFASQMREEVRGKITYKHGSVWIETLDAYKLARPVGQSLPIISSLQENQSSKTPR